MDLQMQRAVLLKALMLVLHYEAEVDKSALEGEKAVSGKQPIKGSEWTRFNATPGKLVKGLPWFTRVVDKELKEHQSALPEGELWAQIRAFALGEPIPAPPDAPQGEVALPRVLDELQHWEERHRMHTLAEMGGCWFLFRLHSQADKSRPPVTVTVLSILPEAELRRRNTKWTEFTLFPPPDVVDEFGKQVVHEYRIKGICKPMGDHLHFLGLLDKVDANYPTALALQYPRGGTNPERKTQADGLMYVTNSKSKQISAPVFARYIEGSGTWDTDEYNKQKPILLARRGSHPPEDIADIFPPEEYERLRKETAKGTVFEAS